MPLWEGIAQQKKHFIFSREKFHTLLNTLFANVGYNLTLGMREASSMVSLQPSRHWLNGYHTDHCNAQTQLAIYCQNYEDIYTVSCHRPFVLQPTAPV